MRQMWSLLLVVLLFVVAVPDADAGEKHVVTHQDVERHYQLHNAEAADSAPAPLVVLLHGYSSKDEVLEAQGDLSMFEWSTLNDVAEHEGFVVAYPVARYGQWNLSDGLDNTTLDDGRPLDDVGLIFAMIDELIGMGIADPKRIYLSGISDGAIMSYRLLCLEETPFAAAAPLIGTMSKVHLDTCAASTAPPIMVIAGTNDRILPYDGWLFRSGQGLSIPETMDHFRLLHGCTGQEWEKRDDVNPDDGSRVREVRWTGCHEDGTVVLLRVEGAGHTLPSFDSVSPEWAERAGGHNQDIESADEIWRFFSQFTLTRDDEG